MKLSHINTHGYGGLSDTTDPRSPDYQPDQPEYEHDKDLAPKITVNIVNKRSKTGEPYNVEVVMRWPDLGGVYASVADVVQDSIIDAMPGDLVADAYVDSGKVKVYVAGFDVSSPNASQIQSTVNSIADRVAYTMGKAAYERNM